MMIHITQCNLTKAKQLDKCLIDVLKATASIILAQATTHSTWLSGHGCFRHFLTKTLICGVNS